MENRDWIKNVNGNSFKVGVIRDGKYCPDFDLSMLYFEALGKKYNSDFFIDKNDTIVFEYLFYYFLKDTDYCNARGINLDKGILLVGGNGVGKTTILKMFIDFFTFGRCKDYSMSELGEKVSIEGITYLDTINFKYDFYLDDIGSEMKSVHFGQQIEVFSSILKRFEAVNFPAYMPDESYLTTYTENTGYSSKRKNNKKAAHIFATTNLTLEDFQTRYCHRVYSRLAGSFNIINFPTTRDKRAFNANVLRG
jgi:hypothetical protein